MSSGIEESDWLSVPFGVKTMTDEQSSEDEVQVQNGLKSEEIFAEKQLEVLMSSRDISGLQRQTWKTLSEKCTD